MEEANKLKNVGYHILPTNYHLFDSLRRKMVGEDEAINTHFPIIERDMYSGDPWVVLNDDDEVINTHFPIIERDLYSGDPWVVLNDDDPWQILNHKYTEKGIVIKRLIFVFTQLKLLSNSTSTSKQRYSRTAGIGYWHGSTGEDEYLPKDGWVMGRRYFDFRLNNENFVESEEKGHWMMHEYNLKQIKGDEFEEKVKYVLCEITHVVRIDLGNHRRLWRKSPCQKLFDMFVVLGYFSKKQGSSAADDDRQVQTTINQDKQNKNKNKNKNRKNLVGNDEEFRTVSISTDSGNDDQTLNSIDLVGKGDDDSQVVTNNLDVQGNGIDLQLGLAAEITDQDKRYKKKNKIKNKNKKNLVGDAEESRTVSISTESGNDDQTLNSIDLVGKGDDDNRVVTNNLDVQGNGIYLQLGLAAEITDQDK